jgi:hypothetical protein
MGNQGKVSFSEIWYEWGNPGLAALTEHSSGIPGGQSEV